MKFLSRWLLPAVVAPVLLWVSGCADTSTVVEPAAPPAAPLYSTSGGNADLKPIATFKQRRSITIAWAKKWIGPEGGRLDFQGFAIEVPAGAVDKVTQFSIHLPVDPHGSERVVAEFKPHGATFKVPVAIELPFAGTSIEASSSPTIVWWNDAWVNMGASLTADGARLRTTTDHFSTYGTTEERGGTATASGG